MKQVMQSLKDGTTTVLDIPYPQLKPNHLLIQTSNSLISPGTEKMLVDFGKASLLDKARLQPEKMRMVWDKIKTDGFFSTLNTVQAKLDQMIPMGYCNVGKIIAVGENVTNFERGQRVVSNGCHAEIVCVPKNLCCKIPENISDEDAVFTVLGAIALQGIRLAAPTLGENFAVIGLGLIGLMTVQLLQTHGCRVLAIDLNQERTALAETLGATPIHLERDDLLPCANVFSRQRGIDGVLITASTKSQEPIHQAAQMCRRRGRIVLVGVTGLSLSRDDFYKKELSFQVSCSYGPGRYDPRYEEGGQDYPFEFVRWTEQRNFEAFLDILALHRIKTKSMLTHRFSILEADQAYQLLTGETKTLGILLDYPKKIPIHTHEPHENKNDQSLANVIQLKPKIQDKNLKIGFIGAGNYATRILIPAFKKTKGALDIIACQGGVSGTLAAKKFGFTRVTTDTEQLFADPEIDVVVIASRHDLHAEFVCQAFAADKHVFVEKPLCLTLQELEKIVAQSPKHKKLMIGFNRRFAPHILKIKNLLQPISEPKVFMMTVNAGEIPAEHWTQDPKIGGGRIIGEACHFIDLLRFLANSAIVSSQIIQLDHHSIKHDKVSISLSFADGSFGVIHYLANGHKAFPKERLEIFTAGKILQLDNFRKLKAYGWSNFKKMNLWTQDKGQNNCVKQFITSIEQTLDSPIPFDEIIEVSRVTLEIANKIAFS